MACAGAASTPSSTCRATSRPTSSAPHGCWRRLRAAYLFVSSRSVYADHSVPGLDETAALAELPPGAPSDEITGESYGPLKVACERAVQDAFAGRAVILRPGLIVGPHDPTGRFTYWPSRVAEGGDVLAPAPPDQAVQLIDARDLAAFALALVERGAEGTFDVVTPAGMLTLGGVLDACREACGSEAAPVWVDERFLLDHAVEPWTELPLWTPGEDFAGFQRSDTSRAVAAGLTVRPIAETAADTLAWAATAAPDPGAAMTREREADAPGGVGRTGELAGGRDHARACDRAVAELVPDGEELREREPLAAAVPRIVVRDHARAVAGQGDRVLGPVRGHEPS